MRKEYFGLVMHMRYFVALSSVILFITSFTFAGLRGEYNDPPLQVIDTIVGAENEDTGIIQTNLDYVDDADGAFDPSSKISNTLDSTRYYLSPYIEWIAFIGLSAAVALLIYNGLLLVFSPLSDSQVAAVKKRIGYIIAGVVLITGFYFILRIILSILLDVVIV